MKKVLLALALVCGVALTKPASAQLADYSVAPNWTFSDINGNPYTLYSILDQGKTVVIDVSAAWCGPCWSYHNTGALESFYAAHGPSGDNTAMVFFIEGELTNTTAQLHGPALTGGTAATNTQGDWTAGTLYPIIDLATATPGASAFLSGYQIGYFPTVYMICPNRIIREIGQATAADIATAMASCPAPGGAVTTDAALISYTGTPTAYNCAAVNLPVIIQNNGSGPLSNVTVTAMNGTTAIGSATYTGTLATTYATATVTIPNVTFSAQPNLSFVITGGDGGTGIVTNNMISANLTYLNKVTAPISEPFSASFPSTDWNTTGGLWFTYGGTAITGHDGVNANYAAGCSFYSASAGTTGNLVLPELNMSALSGNAGLKFWVSYAGYNGTENDRLDVVVSTNCGASWTSIWNKSASTLATHAAFAGQYIATAAADWRQESVDLSAYVGQDNVLVAFKGTSGYGNYCWIDDINLTSTTGVQNISLNSGLSVYPNPATNNITLATNFAVAQEASIEITNVLGQVVYTQNLGMVNAGTNNIGINIADLSAGAYMVNLHTANGVSTTKFVK